ncbi:MAG: hypothetical protein ACLS36_03680 [Streptococcus sp.]
MVNYDCRRSDGCDRQENQPLGLETPRPNGDYELVELVGNVVFKMLISLTMVRTNPSWR